MMEPPSDTGATNGTDETASTNDAINAAETNGIANTNGADPVGITASSGIALSMNPSLENFQSDEQRRVLDTVSKVRKCGLDTVLSLPQIVVCGDQSSGKSSVLEALTEIPFPRYSFSRPADLQYFSNTHTETTIFALALQRRSVFADTLSAA